MESTQNHEKAHGLEPVGFLSAAGHLSIRC